ncbi:LysR family transcriptional regulator [Falsirhodobacter halotolerans]|uniref:LysR family transcriptional regulator n=1 Tax=Falsirhodobacter halotolerans TaxID=1146892 RepID=UPI001FD58BC9|nr:LysR family transcriptional regulator [Falsirhodobacter halotolerans]MCJ8139884.1 LysR family transcriptional regulator [Falsirhodobacter halotolerans]
MDTRQLRTLLAIVQHNSFARAADTVHVTPSAVSQQIRALESELDVLIFQRGTRPPTLTAQGAQVVEMARDMLRREEEARTVLSGSGLEGTLVVGSVRTSALRVLPRAISRMRLAFPQLKVNLRLANSAALIEDVSAGRLDAAVVAENLAIRPGIRWRPFLREPLWLIAPAAMAGSTVADILNRRPYLRFCAPVPLASLIDAELSRMGAAPQVIAELDSISAIMSCVTEGMGVSVVPDVALTEPGAEGLVRLPFGAPQILRQIGLVDRVPSSRGVIIDQFHDLLAASSGVHGIRRDVP